jgi:hypothetical protein
MISTDSVFTDCRSSGNVRLETLLCLHLDV